MKSRGRLAQLRLPLQVAGEQHAVERRGGDAAGQARQRLERRLVVGDDERGLAPVAAAQPVVTRRLHAAVGDGRRESGNSCSNRRHTPRRGTESPQPPRGCAQRASGAPQSRRTASTSWGGLSFFARRRKTGSGPTCSGTGFPTCAIAVSRPFDFKRTHYRKTRHGFRSRYASTAVLRGRDTGVAALFRVARDAPWRSRTRPEGRNTPVNRGERAVNGT